MVGKHRAPTTYVPLTWFQLRAVLPLLILRIISLRKSTKLIAEDKAKFDAVWQTVVEEDANLVGFPGLPENQCPHLL